MDNINSVDKCKVMEIVLDACAITPKGVSPFDNIPRVKLGITTQEIVEIIRECRAGIS